MTFPVGDHALHPDRSVNFQTNRWFGWVDEPVMLAEMRRAAPRIASHADWTREFLGLAERAAKRGHVLRAGFYWRSADLFMRAGDPAWVTARGRFVDALRRAVCGRELGERHAVPYAGGRLGGRLPAYRLRPPHPTGTIPFFGGFDSYVEELTSAFIHLRDAGYA